MKTLIRWLVFWAFVVGLSCCVHGLYDMQKVEDEDVRFFEEQERIQNAIDTLRELKQR